MAETLKTRPISWLKAAQHEFEKFPEGARMVCLTALTIAAEGGKADIAKPLQGIGSGVVEIALPFKSDAFRVVYALQIGEDVWVIHAFQKKSTKGMKTPKREIELVKDRLKRLKEMLK
ncbi:MAG TPA: type II toxin-antitoxin system RelE/ParE family toxin [Bryobacteraceae bacterium]|nr:type II toxin-antitoxin system RelE/ParE family toxin [Bryobacteraceae bacterium]